MVPILNAKILDFILSIPSRKNCSRKCVICLRWLPRSSIFPVNSKKDVLITISIEVDDVDEAEPPSMIEEIPASEDLTPSGRLDSIRKEMSPEEETQQQTSIEERMSKFFD